MATPQVIASVEIEAYDDGTFEVSQDAPGANDNEAAEPQGTKTKSLAQALSMARSMLSGAGQAPAPSQYMPGNVTGAVTAVLRDTPVESVARAEAKYVAL